MPRLVMKPVDISVELTSCPGSSSHWLDNEKSWPPPPRDESVALASILSHWWFGSQRGYPPYRGDHHLSPAEANAVYQFLGTTAVARVAALMPLETYLQARVTLIDKNDIVLQERRLFDRGPSAPGALAPHQVDLLLFERVEFQVQAIRQCPERHQCLGAFLQIDHGVRRLSEASLESLHREWRPLAMEAEAASGMPPAPLYYTPIWRRVGRQFGRDLAKLLQAYEATYSGPPYRLLRDYEATGSSSYMAPATYARRGQADEGSEASEDGGDECIVHYRVGDFLSYKPNQMRSIAARSIAAAVASFVPPPRRVLILDGGSDYLSPGGDATHVGDATSVLRRSVHAVANLTRELRAVLPSGASVRTPTVRASPDEDLLRLSKARRIVTTGGSFGLAGALASLGIAILQGEAAGSRQVRTPACSHHLDLVRTRRAADTGRLLPGRGWEEYEYDLN